MVKKSYFTYMMLSGTLWLAACGGSDSNKETSKEAATPYDPSFEVAAESFADLQLLRYEVPGWNKLSLQQKQLAYYLYEASLSGRDIIYDQRGKYNLRIRKAIEAIWSGYKGNRSDENWGKFKTYAGQVWFSNGIYHHYSNDKILPAFDYAYFESLLKDTDPATLPLENNQSIAEFTKSLEKIVFDPSYAAKMADFSEGIDHVVKSANNFYEGVTQKEVESFFAKFPGGDKQPEWGLNSKLTKEGGQIVEKVWKSGGMYGAAIDKMIFWLEKAVTVAENEQQKKAFQLLIAYYKTGDLRKWDEYAIAWTQNTQTVIDFTNGFIEVYADPLGKKGSFESIVSIKDFESSKRIEAIAKQAQWFEDHAPLMDAHKKKEVKGIDAKVINVVVESGDAAPSTPIGINLPNSNWLRRDYGSKSVSLGNIVHAYDISSAGSGVPDEFAVNAEVIKRIKEHGSLASALHTDMHECIGHASGQINAGVGTPDQTLKNYASTLEEGRADLVALYYILDPKLVEIGVMPSLEVGKAEYDGYMMNGLMTQLVRIDLGKKIEEAHMRNRALIARWVLEKGKPDNVVSMEKRDGKTYVQINDYDKLRTLFGELLREIQRIKSEGDYEAGKSLVEKYGTQIDPVLHKEVKDRYAKLNIKPYKGFIQPKLVPVMDGDKVKDVTLSYPTSFYDQMMEYAKTYSTLPAKN